MSPNFLIRFVTSYSAGVWVSWKIEKNEKDEALNHHWNQERATNKVVWETLQRDNYHAHNRAAFRIESNIQDGDFCKND